jgi:hypothetical protein
MLPSDVWLECAASSGNCTCLMLGLCERLVSSGRSNVECGAVGLCVVSWYVAGLRTLRQLLAEVRGAYDTWGACKIPEQNQKICSAVLDASVLQYRVVKQCSSGYRSRTCAVLQVCTSLEFSSVLMHRHIVFKYLRRRISGYRSNSEDKLQT